MPEPKLEHPDDDSYKGFQNKSCRYWMCHEGIPENEFNCIGCYCPLAFLKCPGPYKIFTDKHGLVRKDCTDCTLPHNGIKKSWNFIQKWLEKPEIWDGNPQIEKHQKKKKDSSSAYK